MIGEIEIPEKMVAPLLLYADKLGLSLEEVVVDAFLNFMKGDQEHD